MPHPSKDMPNPNHQSEFFAGILAQPGKETETDRALAIHHIDRYPHR